MLLNSVAQVVLALFTGGSFVGCVPLWHTPINVECFGSLRSYFLELQDALQAHCVSSLRQY